MQSFLEGRKLAEEQRQANMRFAQEDRQQSLLESYRQANYESNFITPTEGDIYTQNGLPAGQKIPVSLADNIMTNYRLKNKPPEQPEYTISKIEKDGKQISIEHVKGQPIETGKIIGETSQWKPNEGKAVDELTKTLKEMTLMK